MIPATGQNSNGKIIMYNLPEYEGEYVLKILSKREVIALLTAITTLDWRKRHVSLPADLENQDDLDAFADKLRRKLMEDLDLCQIIQDCIGSQLSDILETVTALQTQQNAIQNQLSSNADTMLPPSPIVENDEGKRCGGASFVVDFMDSEIKRVYQEAEDGLLDNLIEATVQVIRAIPIIESLPLDEMVDAINLMFANQVADYNTDFTARRDDLIGSLACFIDANGNSFDYAVWGFWLEYVGETWTDRAAKLFAAFSPLRQTFFSDILAGVFNRPTLKQWFDMIYAEYKAGSQVAIACPTFTCPTYVCAVPEIASASMTGSYDAPQGSNIQPVIGEDCYYTIDATTNPDTVESIQFVETDNKVFRVEDITYPAGITTGVIFVKVNGEVIEVSGTPPIIDDIQQFAIFFQSSSLPGQIKFKMTTFG